jgi:hypothetical protein
MPKQRTNKAPSDIRFPDRSDLRADLPDCRESTAKTVQAIRGEASEHKANQSGK